jgi:excisionase family DNA binding protein
MTVGMREPIEASESEKPALNKMEGVLKDDQCMPMLVGPHNERIPLPRSVFYILQQIVFHMMQGRAITIVPVDKELTTQQAADILNVSRPYLVRLLEEKKIPFFKVGSHRRIRFKDVMDYKKKRDTERTLGLAELTRLSQEFGLYE